MYLIQTESVVTLSGSIRGDQRGQARMWAASPCAWALVQRIADTQSRAWSQRRARTVCPVSLATRACRGTSQSARLLLPTSTAWQPAAGHRARSGGMLGVLSEPACAQVPRTQHAHAAPHKRSAAGRHPGAHTTRCWLFLVMQALAIV